MMQTAEIKILKNRVVFPVSKSPLSVGKGASSVYFDEARLF